MRKIICFLALFTNCFLIPGDTQSTMSGKKALKLITEAIGQSSIIEITGFIFDPNEFSNSREYCKKYENSGNQITFTDTATDDDGTFQKAQPFQMPEVTGVVTKVTGSLREREGGIEDFDFFHYNRGDSAERDVYLQQDYWPNTGCLFYTSDREENKNDSTIFRNGVNLKDMGKVLPNTFQTAMNIPVPDSENDSYFTINAGGTNTNTYFFARMYVPSSQRLSITKIPSSVVSIRGTSDPNANPLTDGFSLTLDSTQPFHAASQGSRAYLITGGTYVYIYRTGNPSFPIPDTRVWVSTYRVTQETTDPFNDINKPIYDYGEGHIFGIGVKNEPGREPRQTKVRIKRNSYLSCSAGNADNPVYTVYVSLSPFPTPGIQAYLAGSGSGTYQPDPYIGAPMIAKFSNGIKSNRQYTKTSVNQCVNKIHASMPGIYAANAYLVKEAMLCGIPVVRIEPNFISSKFCDLEESGKILQIEDFGF